MEETLELVQETYYDMVVRTRQHYAVLLGRTWTLVLKSVRKNVQAKQLPKNVKRVLNVYRPLFASLAEQERELFDLEDRGEGLVLARQLRDWHEQLEQSMLLELATKAGLNKGQHDSLAFDAKRRIAKQHNRRKAVRLSIDQGQIFLDDIGRKHAVTTLEHDDIDDNMRARMQAELDDAVGTAQRIFTSHLPKALSPS